MLRPSRMVALATVVLSSAPPLPAQTTLEELVASVAAGILEEPDYIAVGIAAGRGDQLLFERGFGTRDRATGTVVDVNTQFRVYSIAKPMTAVAAARLAERGVIDLDAPVSRYLADLAPATGRITARQLIGHLSGIRHYRDGEWLKVSQRQCQTARDGLPAFVDDPLEHLPGEAVTYSSFGYVLLSAALEAAANVPFPQLMKDEVFDPSQMTTITLDDPAANLPDRATPHEFWQSTLYDARSANNTCKMGGGGFVASATDLVQFGLAVLSGRLVSDTMKTHVLAPWRLPSGKTLPYGFGFSFDETDDGHRYAWSSGGAIGGRAALVVFPREEVVAAIVASARGRRLVDDALAVAAAFRE